MSVKLLNSKIQNLANKLLQDGERLRIEYSGKQLEQIPEMKAFIDTLGLKRPKVLIGANGRGDSMVAGIAIKDGDRVVLRAAGGCDYTRGTGEVVQLRARVGQGEGRLNLIADTGASVDGNNMAASVSNKGGKLDISLDTDMIRGNLNVNKNVGEMRHPLVQDVYAHLGKELSRVINGKTKPLQETISENVKRIRNIAVTKNELASQVKKVDIEVPENKDVEHIVKKLRDQSAKVQKAKKEKWVQKLNDDDCKFLLDKAKELNINVFDESILKDPDVIKRFRLD